MRERQLAEQKTVLLEEKNAYRHPSTTTRPLRKIADSKHRPNHPLDALKKSELPVTQIKEKLIQKDAKNPKLKAQIALLEPDIPPFTIDN